MLFLLLPYPKGMTAIINKKPGSYFIDINVQRIISQNSIQSIYNLNLFPSNNANENEGEKHETFENIHIFRAVSSKN